MCIHTWVYFSESNILCVFFLQIFVFVLYSSFEYMLIIMVIFPKWLRENRW